MPDPYARAFLADIDGRILGRAVVTVSRQDNTTIVRAGSDDEVASWRSGRAYAFSSPFNGRLTSTAAVTLDDVNLLGGLVKAGSVQLLAEAAATRKLVDGETQESQVEDLTVDGKAVALSDLPLTIDGVGTLSAPQATTRTTDDGIEVQMAGLTLVLSQDWHGLEAGATVTAGELAVCADEDTAASMIPLPKPTSEPSPTPKPTPESSSTPKPKAGGGSGGSSTGGSSTGGSASGGSSSGGSSSGGGSAGSSGDSSGGSVPDAFYSPGPMPAPKPVTTEHVHFPGAVFPVKGKYWYSDDFGVIMADGQSHTGIDIFALKRTPLVAVQDGTIEELRWRSLGGNSLHLVNDNGDYFYYAHLDHYALGISNGVRVTAGEVIGYVGNTGNARFTAPHCHFEVHPGGGGPVDPFPYLEEWRGAKAVKPAPSDGDSAPADVSSPTPSQLSGRHASDAHGDLLRRVGTSPSRKSDGGMAPVAMSVVVGGGLVTALAVRRRLDASALLPPSLPGRHRTSHPAS